MATYHFEEQTGLSIEDSKYINNIPNRISLRDIGAFDITNKDSNGNYLDYYTIVPSGYTGSVHYNKISTQVDGTGLATPTSKILGATLEITCDDPGFTPIRNYAIWPVNVMANPPVYVFDSDGLTNHDFSMSSLFGGVTIAYLAMCSLEIHVQIGFQYFTNLEEFEFGQDLQAVYDYGYITLEDDSKTFMKDENGIWKPGILYVKRGVNWKKVTEIYEKNEANSIQWERKAIL